MTELTLTPKTLHDSAALWTDLDTTWQTLASESAEPPKRKRKSTAKRVATKKPD